MEEPAGQRTGKALTIYQDHIKRMKNCRKKVNNDAPVLALDRYFKQGKYQADSMALGIIEAENRKLLQQINVIYRTRGKIDSTLPKCLFTSNYDQRAAMNKAIEKRNKILLERIKTVVSHFNEKAMVASYEKNRKRGKRPGHKDKVSQEVETWSIIPEQTPITPDHSKRIRCYFDLEARHIRKEEVIKLGRMVIEVYLDFAPIAGENFVRLCRGEGGGSYKNTEMHKVYPKMVCIGGDTEHRKGLGGTSAFGFPFPNEEPILEFAGPGVIGTYSPEKDKNTSQFLITFAAMKPLKRHFVAFGKVISGRPLSMMEEFGTKSGYPLQKIIVTNCGVVSERKIRDNGGLMVPRELTLLMERIKEEQDIEKKKKEEFEEKQQFYKTYGYMTKLNPEAPYPQFPWREKKMKTGEGMIETPQENHDATEDPAQ